MTEHDALDCSTPADTPIVDDVLVLDPTLRHEFMDAVDRRTDQLVAHDSRRRLTHASIFLGAAVIVALGKLRPVGLPGGVALYLVIGGFIAALYAAWLALNAAAEREAIPNKALRLVARDYVHRSDHVVARADVSAADWELLCICRAPAATVYEIAQMLREARRLQACTAGLPPDTHTRRKYKQHSNDLFDAAAQLATREDGTLAPNPKLLARAAEVSNRPDPHRTSPARVGHG
jgi:hypothetical protein